jgi:hypothetical protein
VSVDYEVMSIGELVKLAEDHLGVIATDDDKKDNGNMIHAPYEGETGETYKRSKS